MRQVLSEEDVIRSVHHKFNISEERIKTLLAEGVRGADVEKAALFAQLSGKTMEEVAALRKDYPWSMVQKKIGLTATIYDERYITYRAGLLHRFYGIEEKRAENLLKEGYPNHWIRLAWLLEQHTGIPTEEILQKRTKQIKWKPWAEKYLHVAIDDFTSWIAETRNPALKPKK